jgi:hypothetical protein
MFFSLSRVKSTFPLLEVEGLRVMLVNEGLSSLTGTLWTVTLVSADVDFPVLVVVGLLFLLEAAGLLGGSVEGMSEDPGRRQIFRRNRDIQADILLVFPPSGPDWIDQDIVWRGDMEYREVCGRQPDDRAGKSKGTTEWKER